MVIKITRIAGTKLKADIEGFEIISGRIDEKTPLKVQALVTL